MTLQKHTFLWWSTVETWEGTFNDFFGTLSETIHVGSGTYRVKADFTVYSGSASEDITMYSQENKYKYENEDWVKIVSTDKQVFNGLLSSIAADCRDGDMAQNWEFHPGQTVMGYMTIRYITDRHTQVVDITVFDNCNNTIAYLKSLKTE